MIKPVVGRHVLFTPAVGDAEIVRNQSNKLAAVITEVWSDTHVNLCVFQVDGTTVARTSVPLIQEEDERRLHTEYGFYCEWMPYQKGQAAKAEELEEQLKGNA